MQVRKSLFVALGVILLFGSSYVEKGTSKTSTSGPQFVADGTDPMPKPPRGGKLVAEEAASGVFVADGTDPMPKPPRGKLVAEEAASGVLMADGTDPMPKPPRGKLVAEEAASGVFVADGTDPMPKPKPTRGLQS
jgi:hypothetical protein